MTQQNAAVEFLPTSLDLLGAKSLCQQLQAKLCPLDPSCSMAAASSASRRHASKFSLRR